MNYVLSIYSNKDFLFYKKDGSVHNVEVSEATRFTSEEVLDIFACKKKLGNVEVSMRYGPIIALADPNDFIKEDVAIEQDAKFKQAKILFAKIKQAIRQDSKICLAKDDLKILEEGIECPSNHLISKAFYVACL